MGKVEVKARIRKMTMKNRESKERVKSLFKEARANTCFPFNYN